jgi:uncharacterized Zn finger protein
MWGGAWKPYVPVAKRRANATRYAQRLAKSQKRALEPVTLSGRKITTTFWGQAWCDNLERYSDFANRLPRGRTYVRNGSVIDLVINRGKIEAIVAGSEVYTVKIGIRTLGQSAWKHIIRDCSKSVASLIDLLQGRFDQGIMERFTQTEGGLFPKPSEIEMSCTCPDWARLCKHAAATLYGIGARLDASPELLFVLRDVDHQELVREAADVDNLAGALKSSTDTGLGDQDLGELFGIELEGAAPATSDARPAKRRKPAASAAPRAAKNPRTSDQSGEEPRKLSAKQSAGKKSKVEGTHSRKAPVVAKRQAGKTARVKREALGKTRSASQRSA